MTVLPRHHVSRRRPTRASTVLAALIVTGSLAMGAAACGTGTPPPDSTPAPTGTATATSSATTRTSATAGSAGSAAPSVSAAPTPPPTDPATVFGADGVGPYLIGALLTDLQSRGQVTGVTDSPTCAGTTTALPAGGYASPVVLSFVGGRLTSVRTTSAVLVTPSGVRVGTSLTDAQTRYGGRAEVVTAPSGTKSLVLPVIATPYALGLQLDSGNTTVASITGGNADQVESAARTGATC